MRPRLTTGGRPAPAPAPAGVHGLRGSGTVPLYPRGPACAAGGGKKQGYHSPLLRQQNEVPAAAPWHPISGCLAQPTPWVFPAHGLPPRHRVPDRVSRGCSGSRLWPGHTDPGQEARWLRPKHGTGLQRRQVPGLVSYLMAEGTCRRSIQMTFKAKL